ncbi:MAG TPA: PQQ-binding-like beta-propeller repeat protein [Acidimicrobiia bacterium]|nr:PQQ-binding-like beta-propeller repeat protein [Acidimicrobiia bacterium]
MSGRRVVACLALALLAGAACSSSNGGDSKSKSTTTTPSSTSAAQSVGGAWPTYHRDGARTGVEPNGPTAGSLRRVWETPMFDGAIYAEPLFVGSQVFVATEGNTVYALDATNGQVQWQMNLGDPVPRSELPCGNIDPTGITSTPVVDPGRGLIYVVPFVQPHRHDLVALDLASGAQRFRRPIDAPGADPTVEQQRGALALASNQVLVPYGGLFGDCGDYRGYVVGAPAEGSGNLTTYQVPAALAGAVWAPPGPTVVDNAVYIATGNSKGSGEPDLSNSVIKLSPPGLQMTDSWTPRNRDELSRGDIDLGSTSPSPVSDGLVFVIGKEGVGYLLRADHLGGTGGQVFDAEVCSSGGYGGTAWAPPMLFVPCRDGLVALRIGGSKFSVAWRAAAADGSPIVTGDTVWALDLQQGVLHAYRASDGRELGSAPTGRPANFATPAAGNGLVIVAADRRVIAFGN